MSAFTRWVEEGYRKVNDNTMQHSWRFFARGHRRGELCCGVVRDSRDGAGRPFPLLVIGSGRLEGWERHWEVLPKTLDALWERIETLCVKRAFDLDELKGDIIRLSAPALSRENHDPPDSARGITMNAMHEDMLAVSLRGSAGDSREILQLLASIKGHVQDVPNAIFIGGPPERAFVVAFIRPLNADDFVRLWTIEK